MKLDKVDSFELEHGVSHHHGERLAWRIPVVYEGYVMAAARERQGL